MAKRRSFDDWKSKTWLSRDDRAPPAEQEMKKESLRTVGQFWGMQDEESKWMDEALNPPPPKETAEQKFVRHRDLQHVLKTIILALHREILPNPDIKLFQFPKSKINNGGPVPKQYYPDSVWALEKKYFTAEVQKQAERQYRLQLHEATANTTFATPDATRYCFDRHQRLNGGRLLDSKAQTASRVNHTEPWRGPDFDPDQINCRTRNLKSTTTKSHYTWAHAEKRAVDHKFKRCEHLLEVMNRERRLDIARDVRLLAPDLTTHDRAEIAKERATAADMIMDILLEYKMTSITENAEYLMHTLKEYKLEQDNLSEDVGETGSVGGASVGGAGGGGGSVSGLTVQSETPSFDDASLSKASEKLNFEMKALYSAKLPRKLVNANILGKAPLQPAKKNPSKPRVKKIKPMYDVIQESDGSDRGVVRRPMPQSKSYAAELILLDLDRRGLHTLPLPPEHRLAGGIKQHKPYSMHFERHFDVWDGYLGQEDPRDQFGLVKKGFRTKLPPPDVVATTSAGGSSPTNDDSRTKKAKQQQQQQQQQRAKSSSASSTSSDRGGSGGINTGAEFHLEQVYQSPHRSGVTGRPRPYYLKVCTYLSTPSVHRRALLWPACCLPSPCRA